uniref:Centrosomal protein of 63 kDa isoform X1 n=1 Tax=Populus alba TaxID=43335 RepID=A0A4U5Q767_POPAL|nr:centrosomal protein of 63 kDa isoform X1 [Populus alba]
MSFLNQPHLQKTLFAKDAVIQNLISEKEALHCEVGGLAIILQRIQETVVNMNEEDRRLFSSLLECQGDCDMVVTKEDTDRIEDLVQNSGEPSPNKASSTGTGENRGWGHNSDGNILQGDNRSNSSVAELTCSPLQSPCSELHSAANGPSISVNNAKVNCTAIAHHLDSECSTTQAETSQDPC